MNHIVLLLRDMKIYGASCIRIFKGDIILLQLKEVLLEEEIERIALARLPSLIGEERGELESVCNDLIKKYSA